MPRLLLVISILLTACATAPTSYRQAAPMPGPVAPPPAYTPGFAPGTPGATVYAPPGTGLPTPGQPGYQQPDVPRSPNKRILPATKEPGLWAADGAPQASSKPGFTILDVFFPISQEDNRILGGLSPGACFGRVSSLLAEHADARADVMALPPEARACVLAKLLLDCLNEGQSKTALGGAMYVEMAKRLTTYGQRLYALHCAPGTETVVVRNSFEAIRVYLKSREENDVH